MREKRVFSSVTLEYFAIVAARRRIRTVPAFGNQPDIHKHGGRGKKNGKENGKWMRSAFTTDIMLSKGTPDRPMRASSYVYVSITF